MKRKLTLFLSLFFLGIGIVMAQTQVRGTVVDENGEPAIGVNVQVKGTTQGVATDVNGKFTLSAPANGKLIISYMGYTTQEVAVSANVNVKLVPDTQVLGEVVIEAGYSSTTRRSFTGTAATVSADQISSKNVSNVSNALAGEVPGVTVINSSGQPGTSASIKIRGIGSVNGNTDPLYVVDGIPYEGTISSINPNDIENLTILKDAAATAIYGARGANGVIVITTKKGNSDKSTITVEQRYGINKNLLPRYDVIKDADEYIGLAWEALYNRGRIEQPSNSTEDPHAYGVAYANENLINSNQNGNGLWEFYNLWNVQNGEELIDPDTRQVRPGVTRRYTPENWEDYAFQTSHRSETNVSFSGGSNRSTYFTSLSYLKDVGYSINSEFQRISGRSNLTYRPNDWLNGSMNIGYTLGETKNAGQTEDSGSVFWYVDNMPPIYPLFLRDPDDNWNKIDDPYYPGSYVYDYGTGRRFAAMANSIADANIGIRKNRRHEVLFNTALTARIYKGLTFETKLASTFVNTNYINQSSPFYGPASGSGGSISRTNDELFSHNFLQLLRYRNEFDNHSIEAFVAHESNYWEYARLYASKTNLANPNGVELDNAVINATPSSYKYQYALESYFGQVNYDYDQRYYLSGTVRRDGSSRFLKKKWGTFGSVGAAWILTEEDFLKDNSLLRMLKLKTSYGILGEQGGVGYYPGYVLNSINNYNNLYAFYEEEKGNPDLTWEQSKMFQVGVEFTLGRFLTGSFDYYLKNTDNLLFDRRVAPSMGYAIIKVNDGKLRNQGLEFDLTAHIVKTKDAYLDFRVNGEFLSNILTAMPIEPKTGAPKILDIAGAFGRSEGHSLYDYYMKEYAGVNPKTGVSTWTRYFFDENGDGLNNDGVNGSETFIASLHEYMTKNPEHADRIGKDITETYQTATTFYVGKSALPKVRGGIALNAGYKGFDFSMQFAYSLGGWGYDFSYAQLMHNGLLGSNNWHKDIHKAWKQEGDVTDVPRLSADKDLNVESRSTRFLTNSSFLSLNNVTLGYSLPSKWAESIKMQNIYVSVSADNLALFSARAGYNPTTSITGGSDWYTYKPLTTISGSLRLNF